MALRTDKREKEEIVEELLLNNYDRYYRLAWSYVYNGNDAADIVQNGAYKAILHSADLKRKEYAGTWIYRIMMNEIFSFLKKPRTVSIELTGEGRKSESLHQNDALYRYHGNSAGVPSELSYEDRYEDFDLQRALNSLSPKDKLVVELRYFEDRKIEEIAEILDENVSTVKSRLYRSLKKLRVKLSENEVTGIINEAAHQNESEIHNESGIQNDTACHNEAAIT